MTIRRLPLLSSPKRTWIISKRLIRKSVISRQMITRKANTYSEKTFTSFDKISFLRNLARLRPRSKESWTRWAIRTSYPWAAWESSGFNWRLLLGLSWFREVQSTSPGRGWWTTHSASTNSINTSAPLQLEVICRGTVNSRQPTVQTRFNSMRSWSVRTFYCVKSKHSSSTTAKWCSSISWNSKI